MLNCFSFARVKTRVRTGPAGLLATWILRISESSLRNISSSCHMKGSMLYNYRGLDCGICNEVASQEPRLTLQSSLGVFLPTDSYKPETTSNKILEI